MFTRWFLHILLLVVVIGALGLGGLWWWSLQVPSLDMQERVDRTVTLDNGLTAELVSDPDAPNAELAWYWETGTVSDPEDYPGLHQLFMRVLLYGESASGYRHLESQAGRDPMGSVQTHIDRTHSRVHYATSAAIFNEQVRHFGQLLQLPALPLEAIAYEREQLSGQDAAYRFLTPGEARTLSELMTSRLSDDFSLIRDMSFWDNLSNDAIGRQLAQYANERLVGNLMTVTLRAPKSLEELEELANEAFGSQRIGSAQPASEGQFGLLADRLPDARYEPVSADTVMSGQVQQAPGWRLLFPWQLSQEQRPDARRLVSWFNSHYENAPPRQLRNAGLVVDITASYHDEFLVLNIEPTAAGITDPEPIHATLALFLAQLQNHDNASTQVARLAGNTRAAPELTVRDLSLDPTLFIQLDNLSSDATARNLSQPDLARALPIDLPQQAPERQRNRSEVSANAYELLGWQPRLLVDSPGVSLWHYEDNTFGSYLASVKVRIDLPLGRDQAYQARWRQWAERHGPGWTDRVIWTDQFAESAAQGLRISVDEHGITWHYTDYWSEVEPWLYEWVSALDDIAVTLPPAQTEHSETHRLIRERAGLIDPPTPEALNDRPLTLLLTGQVGDEDAFLLGQWLDDQRSEEQLTDQMTVAPLPAPLERRHRFAELNFSDDRSSVTRVFQLPTNDLRQQVLAHWALPWIQEVMTMAVREEDFAGEMAISLDAPVGHTGLEIRLSSARQDPARMGLYLEGFWQELSRSVDALSQERFGESVQAQANLLRNAAPTLPALANLHWEDISEGRPHFNGRVLRARALEGTNIEGWQYFMRQWLFDGNARQLTVFEIGDEWQDDYNEARSIPINAQPW